MVFYTDAKGKYNLVVYLNYSNYRIMRDTHLRNGVFMLVDKELKNINPNLEEISRTPAGGWYIKSKEESWYVQSLIAEELAGEEDMNEWLSNWNGGGLELK